MTTEAKARLVLLPCPFCGEEPELEDARTIWVVRCACGACVLGERAPEPESDLPDEYWECFRQTAITAWNRRAAAIPLPEPDTAGSREAFEEAFEANWDDPSMEREVSIWDMAWQAAESRMLARNAELADRIIKAVTADQIDRYGIVLPDVREVLESIPRLVNTFHRIGE